ncbi:MAG: cobalamin biosynthesis protein CobW [Devosiaceae bacterium]|nr:cobalamin biosynthesis protein CobW [Devosiaceae bacterium]
MANKIPVTIVTGFLGAGKTTLVRHVLSNNKGRRIALIVNEFGDVGVDGDLLSGCGDEACSDDDIIELANGCICCTVADEFIPTMQALLARNPRPDHIIIETSGLALPQPLVRAFNWPQIKAEVTIDGIVALVDAAALSEGRFAADENRVDDQRKSDEMLDHDTPLGELFEDQLVCADMVVINKTDLISKSEVEQVEKQIERHMRKGTKIIRAANAEVDVAVLLGMNINSQDDLNGRQSHHEKEHDGDLHEHDDFDSFSITLAPNASKAALLADIEKVIIEHDILRLKGFAAISGASARLVVQAVGPRISTWFDREWSADEKFETSLVVIGQAPLDQKSITGVLAANGNR